MRQRLAYLAVLTSSILGAATKAPAEQIIFETATLGPSVTSEIGQPALSNQILGVRFFLSQYSTITKVGGHVLSGAGITHTRANIVQLSGPTDTPDSINVSTPDFLSNSILAATTPSGDSETTLPFGGIVVPPGWYALILGTLPGGDAMAMVRGNALIGSPSFFLQSVGDTGYHDWTVDTDVRFFVKGTLTPEPGTMTLLAGAVLVILQRRGRWMDKVSR